ncbi:MAG: FtsX-like permease family protein [Cyclobacteriaceae bacterium]
MNQNKPTPPKWADRFLEWYCGDEYLEDLQGDLYEHFQQRCTKSGVRVARLVFIIDVIRNMKPHLFKSNSTRQKTFAPMFKHNLKAVARNIQRNKAYATINIFGLALGMTGTLFIGRFVYHELSFEDFHVNASNIYRTTIAYGNDNGFDVHWARMDEEWVNRLTEDLPEIKEQVRFQNYYPRIINVGEDSFKEEHAFSVDSNVFQVFSFPLISGNPVTALNQPFSVVLTESVALKFFGESEVMGRQIEILNEADSSMESYTVTGVMQDVPSNTHLPINLLTSFRNPEERTGWAYNYLMFHKGTDIDAVQAKIPSLIETYLGEDRFGYTEVHLQPLADIHLRSHLAREIIPNGDIFYVWIFSALGVFIILMAIINFTNLAISKALERTKEIGMRKVLGASRGALFRYFMAESFVYSGLASAIAFGLLLSIKSAFQSISSVAFPIDQGLFIVLLALTVLVAIITGIYPALVISGFKPVGALRGKASVIGNPRSVSRQLLIGVQFVISLTMLSCALITWEQFDFLTSKKLGFNTEQVIAITNSPQDVQDKYETLRQEFQKVPGVKAITALMEVPSREIRDTGGVDFEGFTEQGNGPVLDIQVADTNYLEFSDMELLAGRNFSESLRDQGRPNFDEPGFDFREYVSNRRREYILNETAMRQLGYDNPEEIIGKEFAWLGYYQLKKGPIVGVVKDFHQETLHNEVDPVALIYEPVWLRTFLIKLETTELSTTLSAIEGVWQKMFPNYPLESAFLDDMFNQLYKAEQRQQQILTIFSGLAMFIAMLGIFGLISFMIQKRMKELAIRKILGATSQSLLYLFGHGFFIQAAVAIAIASPVSYYFMKQWLDNFAYRITVGAWEFVFAFAVMVFVLGAVILFKVSRSARVNPVDVLRWE